MRIHSGKTGMLAIIAMFAGLAALPCWAKSQTFTGTVSDSMCGAKHMMAGSDAECTRACVKKGSNYALVVGNKVYTLNTSDKATLDKLDKLAGENATVMGTAQGDSINVSSVK